MHEIIQDLFDQPDEKKDVDKSIKMTEIY